MYRASEREIIKPIGYFMEIRVVILTTWQNGEPSIKMTQFWKSSVETCLNFFLQHNRDIIVWDSHAVFFSR